MTPRAVIDAIERDTCHAPWAWRRVLRVGRSSDCRSSQDTSWRFAAFASSLGPAYTSIWHRDPAGRWTFYSTVTPDCSCARYFGARIHRNVVTPIDLEWTTPWTLQARVGLELTWQVTLHSSPMTRLFNTMTQRYRTRVAAAGRASERGTGSRRRVRHGPHEPDRTDP